MHNAADLKATHLRLAQGLRDRASKATEQWAKDSLLQQAEQHEKTASEV